MTSRSRKETGLTARRITLIAAIGLAFVVSVSASLAVVKTSTHTGGRTSAHPRVHLLRHAGPVPYGFFPDTRHTEKYDGFKSGFPTLRALLASRLPGGVKTRPHAGFPAHRRIGPARRDPAESPQRKLVGL